MRRISGGGLGGWAAAVVVGALTLGAVSARAETVNYFDGVALSGSEELAGYGTVWSDYSFHLDWEISEKWDDSPTHPWLYTYTLTADSTQPEDEAGESGGEDLKHDIGHILVEVPEGAEADDFIAVSPDASLTVGSQPSSPSEWGPDLWTDGMWALKLESAIPEFSGSSFQFTWAFWSNRMPEWGDFYLKGGQANYAISDYGGVVARPGAIVPEPSTYAMLAGAALMGLALRRWRRSRAKGNEAE